MNLINKAINKIKIFLILLSVIFFGLVIYQNKIYFFTKNSLSLSLFFKKFTTPPLYNIFLYIFFIGVCLAVFLILYVIAWYKEKQYAKVLDKMEIQLEHDSNEKDELINKVKKLEEKLLSYKKVEDEKENIE